MRAPALPMVAESVTLSMVAIHENLKILLKKSCKIGLKTIIPKVAPNDKPKLASYRSESGSINSKIVAMRNKIAREFVLLLPRMERYEMIPIIDARITGISQPTSVQYPITKPNIIPYFINL